MNIPAKPKIYHIIHVDRLPSIIADGWLWCDAEIIHRSPPGTTIGMNSIKQRRLTELTLSSHPDLYVGACVPFYFCPRSIMLYLIYRSNHPELTYSDGQGPIIHLEADFHNTIEWADEHRLSWAFTLSNAGARYFEDRCDIKYLKEIDWDAVQANQWMNCKEGKQAEFLIENQFPWELITRIGVLTAKFHGQVTLAIKEAEHKPSIDMKPDWYY